MSIKRTLVAVLGVLSLAGCGPRLFYEGDIGDLHVKFYKSRPFTTINFDKMIIEQGDTIWAYKDRGLDEKVDVVKKNEDGRKYRYDCRQEEILAEATENYQKLLRLIEEEVRKEVGDLL